MSNPVAEMMDVFFNGRSAPKGMPPAIKIQISAEQITHIQNGGKLLFTANDVKVFVSLKGDKP